MRIWYEVYVTGLGWRSGKLSTYSEAVRVARDYEERCFCNPNAGSVVIMKCKEYVDGISCKDEFFAPCNPDPGDRPYICGGGNHEGEA